MRTLAKGKIAISAVPEWVAYALSLAFLHQAGKEDVVSVWSLVEIELKRSRERLRKAQGLPDEFEGKTQAAQRKLDAADKVPHFRGARITNRSEYTRYL